MTARRALMVATLVALCLPAPAAFGMDEQPPQAGALPAGILPDKQAESAGPRRDGVGFFEASTGRWSLPGRGEFFYGIAGDTPLLCDWDGDGLDTPGIFRPSNGFVHLRNQNSNGLADLRFFYGDRGDLPICGDWNGDGLDTVGVYRPAGRVFLLRDTNSQGTADRQVTVGDGTGFPVAGDWNGDGFDALGLWNTSSGRIDLIGLDGSLIYSGFYGEPGDVVMAGDWDLDGRDTLGVHRDAGRAVLLSNDVRNAEAEITMPVAGAGGIAVAGRFGPPTPRDPGVGDPAPGDPEDPPLPPFPGVVALEVGDEFLTVDGSPAVFDSPWPLAYRASDADIVVYMEARHHQGFNGILISLIDPDNAANHNGDRAFDGEWYGSLSAGFSARIGSIVDAAAARDMVVGIAVAGASDRPAAAKLDADLATEFGRHVGSLWGNRPNVFWILGGHPISYPGDAVGIWDAMAGGLREAGAAQPITYHPWGPIVPNAILRSDWLDFVSVHASDHRPIGTFDHVARYAGQGRPVIDIEPAYEGIDFPDSWHPWPAITADDIERQAVESLEAGAGGLAYGHASLAWWSIPGDLGPWGQQVPWWDALEAPGVERLMAVAATATPD